MMARNLTICGKNLNFHDNVQQRRRRRRQQQIVRRGTTRRPSVHAELVALGVGHDDPVLAVLIVGTPDRRTQTLQAAHLRVHAPAPLLGADPPRVGYVEVQVVRRHVRCADCRCDRAGNVTFGARGTSRSVRQSCRNVTFGAPIRTGCVCRRWPCGGEGEAVSRSLGGRQGRAEGAGGGWRSERDVCGAANVTLGATNVTPYTMTGDPED